MKKKFIVLSVILSILIGIPALLSVRVRAADKKKAFIISHYHYDPVWTNTQAGETLRSFAIMHQQLEYAEQEPLFKFTLSEIDAVKPYWDAYPGNRALMLRLAREGRLEFTGGYNEPDESEVGGEALLRNIVYGKLSKESMFDTTVLTLAQHDVFGHAPQLPQIILGAGQLYTIFTRGNAIDMPGEFFWLGPDGSAVLTKIQKYDDSAGKATLFGTDHRFYDLTNNGMFISGGDFQEPDRTIGARVMEKPYINIVIGTFTEFFQAVERSLSEAGRTVAEISRDHNPVFDGCYTSRIDTKLANRRLENLIVDAEKFSSIYSLESGAGYPWEALDLAWRLLFFGQHHDALTGSDNENVNLDLLTGWHEAAVIAQTELDRSLNGLASEIDTVSRSPKTQTPMPVIIFNSLNWERNDPVEITVEFPKPVKAFKVLDSNARPVLFELLSPGQQPPYSSARILVTSLNVPPMGYSVIYIAPSESFPIGAVPKPDQSPTLENDFYRIAVDPGRGGIKSLYAKQLNRELIDSSVGLGNEIYAIEESAGGSSPWGLSSTGRFWRAGDNQAQSIAVSRSAVSQRIIVRTAPFREQTGNGQDKEPVPEIVREIVIYNNSPRIDFITHLNDFKGRDILFKAGFPMDLPNTAAVFEERFASVTRERNTMKYLPDTLNGFNNGAAAFRGREYPAYNWVGLSPATALTFVDADNKVVSRYPLAIGELILPEGDNDALKTANKLAQALIKAGVTTTPTADTKARTNAYYGFRITLGVSRNNVYANKLLDNMDPDSRSKLDLAASQHGAGFLFVEDPGSLTPTPERQPIPILIIEAQSKQELEKAINDLAAQLNAKHEITLPARTNLTSFKSLMSGAGTALLNSGNPGYSLEPNGMLTMSLMRSSTGSPAGKGYSDNWETENWNHGFRYALFPHRGDWDQAGAARAGFEFNFPMIAVQTSLHKGPLPGDSFSFMDTGGANVIITALKPAGYPVAEGIADIKGTNKLSIRVYNPGMTRTRGNATLSFPFTSVSEADLLDRELAKINSGGDSFPISLSQFKIQTYLVELKSDQKLFKPDSVKPAASDVPVYVRYWETNQNAAPKGFMPVTVIVEPNGFSEDRKTFYIKATAASSIKDRNISGDLKFILPQGAEVLGKTGYDLPPLGVETFDFQVAGLDPGKLSKQFIAVQIEYNGALYEDVLTFNDWKIFNGGITNGSDPLLDDSGWESVPLPRFWSGATRRKSTTWYRREVFIPNGINDTQMLFERPRNSEIEVYINGELARKEKWGLSYRPLISQDSIRFGEENLIAVKYVNGDENMPAWGLAFRGSEALFNRDACRLNPGNLALKPGDKASFKVEIVNPFNMEIKGTAVLASPVETWKQGGMYSLIQITPAAQSFSAGPGAHTSVTFDVKVPPGAMPGAHVAAVKLMYKGMTSYSDTLRITIKP